MALIRPGGVRRRRPYAGGAYLLQTWKARVYARAWPRRRGRSSIPWQQAARDRLALSQHMAKRMPERERSPMREGLERFMAANTGVRGLSAIRLRDWITQILYGRAWSVTAEDGTTFYSAQVQRDCSDFLDWMDPWLGSLLVRTNTEWLPTVQCKPGRVLTLTGDGPWPDGCPEAQIPPAHAAMGGYLPEDQRAPEPPPQEQEEFVTPTAWRTFTASVNGGAGTTVDLGGKASHLVIRASPTEMRFAFQSDEQFSAGDPFDTPHAITPFNQDTVPIGPNAGIRAVRIENVDTTAHTYVLHAGIE